MAGDGTISDRVVAAAVAIALLLGIALYNIVPLGNSSGSRTSGAVVAPTSTTSAPAASGANGPSGGALGTNANDGVFGSGSTALQSGATASSGSGPAVDVPDAPDTPSVPNPTCPTSVANDAYEQIVDPVSTALGQSLPRDNVRLLAEIAAGCSNESAATPVIGLALDLSRLVPDTGVPPVGLAVVPGVSAPAIPPAVIDALEPIAGPIRDGCANVALLGILVGIFPGAAHVPVYGSDLAKALVPAATLCAQFEG